MNDPLKEAQEVLDDLENDLAKMKSIWLPNGCDDSSTDPKSKLAWLKQYYRCYLHGASSSAAFFKVNIFLSSCLIMLNRLASLMLILLFSKVALLFCVQGDILTLPLQLLEIL